MFWKFLLSKKINCCFSKKAILIIIFIGMGQCKLKAPKSCDMNYVILVKMFAISANKKISFILKQSSSFKFFRCIGNRLFTQTFFAFNIQNVFPIFYVHFSNEFGKDSIKIIFSQSLKNLQIKKKSVFNLQFRGSQPVSCVPPE